VVVDQRARATFRRWRVWLMHCQDVPGAPAATCLVFDAGDVVRRVWDPPAHWQSLSDDALLTLMDVP
jgi:hypothetical protein